MPCAWAPWRAAPNTWSASMPMPCSTATPRAGWWATCWTARAWAQSRAIRGCATAPPGHTAPKSLWCSRIAGGSSIVAYNAAYDLTLLEREAVRYGHAPLPGPGPVIDPLVIDKAVDRYRRGKRTLTAAAAHYGVELPNAHDAGADAVAAGRVAQAIVRAYPELAAIAVAELHARQVDWCREQAESYQAWRRANGEPEFTTSGAWPVR